MLKTFSIIKYLQKQRLVPSRYIELVDQDTEIDYKAALTEMSRKFNELKKRWDANEAELMNASKILGYGKE
jgi:type I restriction enzyme M protein